MKITKEELRKLILAYLEKNRLMTLATSSGNIPWAATVFFAYEQDLNVYFLSEEETRKIQNILKNTKVAATIDRDQPGSGKVRGIQLEGVAEVCKAPSVFLARYSWAKDYLATSRIYKITPSKIIYLDDERFGPGGKEELILK